MSGSCDYLRHTQSQSLLHGVSISDDEEFARLSKLYLGMTEQECRFIVAQWDATHGLEPWQMRLRKKEQEPLIQRKRQGIISVLLLMAIFPFVWFANDYSNAKRSRTRLEYIYARAPENRALSSGLKWIDNEIEEMREAPDENSSR